MADIYSPQAKTLECHTKRDGGPPPTAPAEGGHTTAPDGWKEGSSRGAEPSPLTAGAPVSHPFYRLTGVTRCTAEEGDELIFLRHPTRKAQTLSVPYSLSSMAGCEETLTLHALLASSHRLAFKVVVWGLTPALRTF